MNFIATVLLFIQVDGHLCRVYLCVSVCPQRRLQCGLVLQTLLNECVIFILEAGRGGRRVDGQDGFPYTPVQHVPLPGRVAVPAQVYFNDRLLQARGTRRGRGGGGGTHLKDGHATVPLAVLALAVSVPGQRASAVGAQGVGGAFGGQREGGGGVLELDQTGGAAEARPVGMEESVVHEHEDDAGEEAGEDDAERGHREGVRAGRQAVQVPQRAQGRVLQQDHEVVDEETAAGATFLHVEPAEDVDDAHHHVEDDFFPLGDAELGLAVHDPEGHDAPVQHDEDAEVELKDGGEEGEGHHPSCDGEEMPAELNDDRKVADGLLVVTGVT